MSHIVLDHLAKIFGIIWRLFNASSLVSLLTPMSRCVTLLVNSREIVFVAIASRASDIVREIH